MATELATAGNGHHPRGMSQAQMPALTIDNVWTMAESAAASKLFPGIATTQQAFTLMMLCQADGMHPMHAIRRYHIIQGRPTMRSDAVQAEFQADGGKIKIIRCDEHEARAVFSHPKHQPEGVEFSYSIEQAKLAGLTQGTWKTHPADMLWARLITKGVRRVHPGIVVGISTPEEVNDVVTIEAAAEVRKAEAMIPAPQPLPRGDVAVPGQPSAPNGLDERPYALVVSEAVAEIGRNAEVYASQYFAGEVPDAIKTTCKPRSVDLHRHILNATIQAGHYKEGWPASNQLAVKALAKLYDRHRDFMREQFKDFENTHTKHLNTAIEEELERRRQETMIPAEDESQEPEDDTEAEFAELRGGGQREPGSDG